HEQEGLRLQAHLSPPLQHELAQLIAEGGSPWVIAGDDGAALGAEPVRQQLALGRFATAVKTVQAQKEASHAGAPLSLSGLTNTPRTRRPRCRQGRRSERVPLWIVASRGRQNRERPRSGHTLSGFQLCYFSDISSSFAPAVGVARPLCEEAGEAIILAQ